MQSTWVLDLVDTKRQLIKVNKLDSTVSKTIFVSDLVEAKIHQNTLLVICEDCVWMIDIITGVRRRVSEKAIVGQDQLANLAIEANLDLPEFLKKRQG